jgi:hypothetical protein
MNDNVGMSSGSNPQINNDTGGQKMAFVIQEHTFEGEDIRDSLKATLKNLKAQGVRVPAIEAGGKWKFQGFEIDFETPEAVSLPIGHRYLKIGDRKLNMAATEDSWVTVYSVAEGTPLSDKDEKAVGDLLSAKAPSEDE